jgi:hypothetical protein
MILLRLFTNSRDIQLGFGLMKPQLITNVLFCPFYDFMTSPRAEMNLYSTLEKGPNRGAVSAGNTCSHPNRARMSVSGTETC